MLEKPNHKTNFLHYMRSIADAFPDFQFVQVALAQITWCHHIAGIDNTNGFNLS